MNEGTMTSLDDLLPGGTVTAAEPIAEETVETPPAEETEARSGQPRDEHGRFAPKGETPPEEAAEAAPAPSAPPAPEESTTVPRTALQDERRKRQELERQLAEISQRLTQAPPPAPQPIPDQWEDPEGHTRYLVQQAAVTAREEALAEVRRERVMLSAEAAKQRHPDYLDKVAVFEQLSAQNPALAQTMIQQPDPAEYAYNIAKQHEEFSKYGSLDAMLAAKRAEWEAEALEGLKASIQSPAPPPPTSLATERNVGSRAGPAWSGPATLSELLA